MKVLICGSFDPVTLGHVELIRRACRMFDEVIVGIFGNSSKKCMFSLEDRYDMLHDAISVFPNAKAEICHGLVAKYVHDNGIDFIVKGVRNGTDCAYELEIAHNNQMIYGECETVLLVTPVETASISSTLVRELILNGEDPGRFVPDSVTSKLDKKC